jgi:hypothetical protein
MVRIQRDVYVFLRASGFTPLVQKTNGMNPLARKTALPFHAEELAEVAVVLGLAGFRTQVET